MDGAAEGVRTGGAEWQRRFLCGGEAGVPAGCQTETGAGIDGETGDSELLAAMGEVVGGGGKGGVSGGNPGRATGGGGEPFREAERGVSAQGGELCAADGR